MLQHQNLRSRTYVMGMKGKVHQPLFYLLNNEDPPYCQLISQIIACIDVRCIRVCFLVNIKKAIVAK